MIEFMTAWLRDLLSRQTWLLLLDSIARQAPGQAGHVLRRRLMGGRFKRRGKNLVIYPKSYIFGPDAFEVGDNCTIGFDCMIQANGGVEFGDDVILGPGVKIWSVNHRSSRTDVSIWEQGYEHKRVVIGNGVWIGANAFVMPGATIGDHVIISAGSVVGGKEVTPYSILAGNPARKVGTREATERVPESLAP